MIGLWHFHRVAREHRHEWWNPASRSLWQYKYNKMPICTLVTTLVRRYMRRYKTPRYVGEFNALVERVCRKNCLHDLTRKSALINGLRDRVAISINAEEGFLSFANWRLMDIRITVLPPRRKCNFCSAELKRESHLHCGSRNCKEIAAFVHGDHGLFRPPKMKERSGLAAVAAFLRVKGKHYGKLSRNVSSTH